MMEAPEDEKIMEPSEGFSPDSEDDQELSEDNDQDTLLGEF